MPAPKAKVELNTLTANKVKAAKHTGESKSAERLADGGTLYLQIGTTNTKSWVQVLRFGKQRRNIGLGSYPLMGLADARRTATRNRLALLNGTPIGDIGLRKRTPGATTFEDAFREVVAKRKPTWKHPAETERDWLGSMAKHMAALMPMDVARIATADVVAVLEPHWSKRRRSALKYKQRMGQAFKWAVAMQLRPDNPVDAVDAVLINDRQTHESLPAIHHSNAREVLDAVRRNATLPRRNGRNERMWVNVHLALEFAALTAARIGMVLGATWDEVDLDAKVWTVHTERMKIKRKKPFRCPLSERAVAVLESVDRNCGFVFPTEDRTKMDDTQPQRLLHATMDVLFADGFADRCPNPDEARKAVPHGFRSTFNVWASEVMGSRWSSVADAQLAHAQGEVQRAYNRTDYLDERRELVDAWGQFVAPSE